MVVAQRGDEPHERAVVGAAQRPARVRPAARAPRARSIASCTEPSRPSSPSARRPTASTSRSTDTASPPDERAREGARRGIVEERGRAPTAARCVAARTRSHSGGVGRRPVERPPAELASRGIRCRPGDRHARHHDAEEPRALEGSPAASSARRRRASAGEPARRAARRRVAAGRCAPTRRRRRRRGGRAPARSRPARARSCGRRDAPGPGSAMRWPQRMPRASTGTISHSSGRRRRRGAAARRAGAPHAIGSPIG